MESFMDCISCCHPVSLSQLLEQNNDQRMQTLGTLTSIVLKSFSTRSVWGLKRCWNCRDLHIVNMSESDFYTCICNLPTITEAWVLQHNPECALTSITIDNCVICQESYEALYHCFRTPCFASLCKFTLRSAENNKSSRINDKRWVTICEYLKAGSCPHLHSIHLPGNAIGCEGIEALMSVYQQGSIKQCVSLDLSDNKIGNKGAMALSRIFNDATLCESLERLDLSKNGIRSKGFDCFFTQLGTHTYVNLHTFNLAYNSPSTENIVILCHILEMQCCPQLRCLNLSGIALKSNSSVALASAIRANCFKYLEELYLTKCSLNVESIEHICRAIMDCPLQLLKHLCLSQNHLGHQCIQLLVQILQRSCLPSLIHLDLSDNKINDLCIHELNNNYTDDVLSQVEIFDLSKNCINNEGAYIIFNIIRHRQWCNLRDLNLEHNKFSTITSVQLRSLLEMDNTLDTIRLSDMTKRRVNVPLYRREDVMNPSKEDNDSKSESKSKSMSINPDIHILKNLDKPTIQHAISPQVMNDNDISPVVYYVSLKQTLNILIIKRM